MIIEGLVSKIISKMIHELKIPNPDSEDYQLLLLYLLFAEARVQKTAESQNNLIDKQMKIIAEMDRNSKIRTSDIDRVKVGYVIPNLLPLQIATRNFPILHDLSAILIISDSDRMFITSDFPLTKYNQFYVNRNYHLRGYGLGNIGAQLFYPISPTICLCLYDSIAYDCIGCANNIVRIKKGKDIDELNKLFYLNSFEYLFFNENVLETYIKRLTNELTPVHDLNKEVTILGSDENKLIQVQNCFVKDKIRIPFMRIKQSAMRMQLPLHMAGPMRPHAIEFMKMTNP